MIFNQQVNSPPEYKVSVESWDGLVPIKLQMSTNNCSYTFTRVGVVYPYTFINKKD